MAAATLRGSPDMANGSSNLQYANDPRATQTSHKYSTSELSIASYNDGAIVGSESNLPAPSGPSDLGTVENTRRSVSVTSKSRELSAGNLNYTTRKPIPDMPPILPQKSASPRDFRQTSNPPEIYVSSRENVQPPGSSTATSVSSPTTNTTHSTSDQRRDWASDRSPLQKLELTLTGISKEEKRARVQAAEQRLRKRLARQKAEKEREEDSAIDDPQRPHQNLGTENWSVSDPAVNNPPRDVIPESPKRNVPLGPRQPGNTVARHNRAVSMNPQYKTIHRPKEAQHLRAEDAIPPLENIVNVPRRPVTISGSAAKPAPAISSMKSPYSSQQKPQKLGQSPIVSSTAIVNNGGEEVSPILRTAHDSVESYSKPKVSFNVPPPTPPPIFEWKNSPILRLDSTDFDFQRLDMAQGKAWWEGAGTTNRRQSRALPKNYKTPAQKLTGVSDHKNFQPKLFLLCGPLLRFTGIKKISEEGAADKELWRGSIMIVTKDSLSSRVSPPTLRLFSQPMDLLPPPPTEISEVRLAPEYVDPIAGLMKVGRDGRPLYVKPVEHLDEGLDLSAMENDDGLYELKPSTIDYSVEGAHQPVPSNRIHPTDGETEGLQRQMPGVRLYVDTARDVTFWRFNLEIELNSTQQRIAYRINQGPALGFWVPAMGQTMNMVFYSGNGFSPSVDSDHLCGPDPLWRDILNEHQTRPFHVIISGGDQIFNDSVTNSHFFHEWMKIKNPADRYGAPFTPEFRAEIEKFYLEHYASWYSQGLFSLANSQIPMINMWNDHEIFEGYGSYQDEFMSSVVISGLGKIAFKYYLLFQHHSVPDETEIDEPSWILGSQPGPYIEQRSRNLFMSLGGDVVFLGLDCRTERRRNEVLYEETCDLIWDRCHNEIHRGRTKHLLVLSSVPIAYPRGAMIKNFLNSRKSLGKSGILGGLVNRSGGNVEMFDDHWAGKHLKAERTWLVEDLQDLAAEKSVRVTILSGDVHLGAIGQFYSNHALNIPKDKDYRYMPNVISSSIADMPETDLVSDMLNKRNSVHHMDSNTDEDVIPIFTEDTDDKPRNNKKLLPRRNWCSIQEYRPASNSSANLLSTASLPRGPRPGMLQRTLSLGRGDRRDENGPGNKSDGLLRRFSTRRGPPPTREINFEPKSGMIRRRASIDSSVPRPYENGDSYFSGASQSSEPRPGMLRRPTHLNESAGKKGANTDDAAGAFINLEGGLSIILNMEVSSHDPSGITVPYKMLVPALYYEGTENDPPPTQVVKGWRKWLRVPRRKKTVPASAASDDDPDDYEDHDTIKNTRANAATAQHQYEEYSGSEDSDGEVPQRLPPEALVDSSIGEYDEDDD
ncbi:hypothetical protein N7495_003339 [Penicillium taxi]|uniref:uncharacterized protein n=1 Tax=Penicillium taxi TaxID=168475 RepID=UPI002544E5EF|nr:uncharacterized protein N7495_003339 [Penicillium taxi]KAJ5902811.1 hypothetical protein N7495_003339 [Penicillium taxi]